MATQTCQISATPGFTSVTMRARTLRGVVVQSVAVAAASADDPSLYEGVFTDLPADRYRFTLDNADGPIASTIYPVTLTTAVFSADDEQLAIRTNTDTLVSRVTSTVATLWANLTAMISGSGGTAAYTTTALANAPAGGGGGSGTATIEKQDQILSALTGTTIEVLSPVATGGRITLINGDNYVGAFRILLTIDDSAEAVKTFLEACDSVIFGAGRFRSKDEITGTVTIADITHASGITTVPVTIATVDTPADDRYTWHLKGIDSDGEHVRATGPLTVLSERVTPPA